MGLIQEDDCDLWPLSSVWTRLLIRSLSGPPACWFEIMVLFQKDAHFKGRLCPVCASQIWVAELSISSWRPYSNIYLCSDGVSRISKHSLRRLDEKHFTLQHDEKNMTLPNIWLFFLIQKQRWQPEIIIVIITLVLFKSKFQSASQKTKTTDVKCNTIQIIKMKEQFNRLNQKEHMHRKHTI